MSNRTSLNKSRVTVHYIAKLSDGTIFENTLQRRPIEFELDDDSIIKGIRLGVQDMLPGQRKTLKISPDQGFGLRDPEQEFLVSLDDLPEGVKVGDMISLDSEQGPFTGVVKLVRGARAVIDANHPLCGETLHIDVQLLKRSQDSDQASH